MKNLVTRICVATRREFAIEGWRDPQNRRLAIAASVFAAAAFLVRLLFWAYTRRTWEDALITVLHSENFVNGIGLTHYLTGQPPVHGFTSPLGVLVPLMGDLVEAGYGLGLVKLASAVCGSLAVIYIAAIGIHPKFRASHALLILPIGFVALDYNQIMWGMSGMETQVVTTVVLASIYYLLHEKLVATGILLGLCLLARPDMAFWAIIVGVYLVLTHRVAVVRAVLPAAFVYVPWLCFATSYYGSPIPNTLAAKYVGYQGFWWVYGNPSLAAGLHGALVAARSVFQPLGPCFGGHGTGFVNSLCGYWISYAMMFVAFIGTCLIFLRRRRELFPCALFVLTYGAYYVFATPVVFPWYLVPLAAVSVLLATYGISGATSMLGSPKLRTYSALFITAAYLACVASVLPCSFEADRRIQFYIEDGVRKQIGLYLSTVMEKDQSVGCECLGYIGYYSRRTVYDYPGLCNPMVVEYLKTREPSQRSLYCMLDHFRPDYIVLRSSVYQSYQERGGSEPWVLLDYREARWFGASAAAIKDVFAIGKNIDTSFVVLQKRSG